MIETAKDVTVCTLIGCAVSVFVAIGIFSATMLMCGICIFGSING